MTNHEIIKKLIGNVIPVGDSGKDARSFENLKSLLALAENLLFDIDDVANSFAGYNEASIVKARDEAKKFLTRMAEEFKPVSA